MPQCDLKDLWTAKKALNELFKVVYCWHCLEKVVSDRLRRFIFFLEFQLKGSAKTLNWRNWKTGANSWSMLNAISRCLGCFEDFITGGSKRKRGRDSRVEGGGHFISSRVLRAGGGVGSGITSSSQPACVLEFLWYLNGFLPRRIGRINTKEFHSTTATETKNGNHKVGWQEALSVVDLITKGEVTKAQNQKHAVNAKTLSINQVSLKSTDRF